MKKLDINNLYIPAYNIAGKVIVETVKSYSGTGVVSPADKTVSEVEIDNNEEAFLRLAEIANGKNPLRFAPLFRLFNISLAYTQDTKGGHISTYNKITIPIRHWNSKEEYELIIELEQ